MIMFYLCLMKNRNLYVFLVSLLFLTSKVGLAFNVHICGGSISEISFIWKSAGCEMSIHEEQKDFHPDSHELKAENCCGNEIMVLESGETEDIFSKKGNNFPNSSTIIYKKDLRYREISFSKLNPKIIEDPPKQKLFLLYRSFIFYG